MAAPQILCQHCWKHTLEEGGWSRWVHWTNTSCSGRCTQTESARTGRLLKQTAKMNRKSTASTIRGFQESINQSRIKNSSSKSNNHNPNIKILFTYPNIRNTGQSTSNINTEIQNPKPETEDQSEKMLTTTHGTKRRTVWGRTSEAEWGQDRRQSNKIIMLESLCRWEQENNLAMLSGERPRYI